MQRGGPAMTRPYVVGLLAAVATGSLALGAVLALSTTAARDRTREQEVTALINNLSLPPSIQPMELYGDCHQVNVDLCLTSTKTPPATLAEFTSLLAEHGSITESGCGESLDGTTQHPDARRCSLDAEIDGVDIRVLLWPHVADDPELSNGEPLTFRGTEIWVDIATSDDI